MKRIIPFFALFLCLTLGNSLQANNTNPSETPDKTAEYAVDKIFFSDSENDFLFVDFEPVTESVMEINLYRGEDLMMVDRVEDLPSNTIYEFNTGLLRSGDYTIELVTFDGVKIHKKLLIE
jgi:hypothetical protein